MTPNQFERHLERRVRRLTRDIDVHGWFHGWHVHADMGHEVKRSRVRREIELRVLFRLHDRLAAELAARTEPFQIWVAVHASRPGDDSIYVQTPPKSPGPGFPHVARAHDWRCSVPDWLPSHIARPAFDIGLHRAGRSVSYLIQQRDAGGVPVRDSRRRRSVPRRER